MIESKVPLVLFVIDKKIIRDVERLFHGSTDISYNWPIMLTCVE